jgi:hypothetical protein
MFQAQVPLFERRVIKGMRWISGGFLFYSRNGISKYVFLCTNPLWVDAKRQIYQQLIEEMGKQATKLGTFAHVDGPIWQGNIVCDVEEDRMRIVRDEGCLGKVKSGAVVYNHCNNLEDKWAYSPHCHSWSRGTLNAFVRETGKPQKS